jgi:hypothetical protein
MGGMRMYYLTRGEFTQMKTLLWGGYSAENYFVYKQTTSEKGTIQHSELNCLCL